MKILEEEHPDMHAEVRGMSAFLVVKEPVELIKYIVDAEVNKSLILVPIPKTL